MAYLVVIDAGHGGSDPGASYMGRQEKNDNLALALEVGEILEKNGVDVRYTRTDDVYNTPFEKAMMGNNAGADLFISIHRDSGNIPNTASGVSTLVYNDEGIKSTLARNINQNLGKVGYKVNGVVERPNLVVLKRTKMPAVLVETGFINNNYDNSLFDEKFDETAKAIADGILSTLNITPEENHKRLFRVQTGAFSNEENARALLEMLKKQGYPAFIVMENGLYKVQVGAYSNLDNAVTMENKLRSEGYDTFISF